MTGTTGRAAGWRTSQGYRTISGQSTIMPAPGEPDNVYYVWPASDAALTLEREQWAMFVAWNTRYEAGTTRPDTHPGQGGIDVRYDELTALLTPQRATPPEARRLAAEWRRTDQDARYRPDGPGYVMRWHPEISAHETQ
jgi:hypothetical protein